MKRIALILAILAIAACDISLETDMGNPRKPLELTTKQESYVAVGNSFAFHYLESIEAAATKDYVVSPLSMQFLLGMILDGARGKTADEICATLGFGKDETAEVNEYCRNMLAQLPKLDAMTSLMLANAIFVDDGYKLNDSYMETVRRYYGATASNLDFSDTKASADVINKWCSDNTRGMVPKVLDETSSDILAYLLNALYFKSQWSSRFDVAATVYEKFSLADGSADKVLMMKQYSQFDYSETELFQALTMPYGNGAFEMTVLLPKGKATTAQVASWLRKNSWFDFRLSMYVCSADLWLPRFETAFGMELNDLLSAMGMPTAFVGGADFSGMSPAAMCLSFVRQDAAITVDEEGSEAAAVSTAGMQKNSLPGDAAPPVIFHANHPFLYLISENSTGAILFAGRYSGK